MLLPLDTCRLATASARTSTPWRRREAFAERAARGSRGRTPGRLPVQQGRGTQGDAHSLLRQCACPSPGSSPLRGRTGVLRERIVDRDPLYTEHFKTILASGAVELLKLPPSSPNLNAYAERFVRSITEECLDRVVPLGERHLRRLVSEYMEHFHTERNHQGLANIIAFPNAPPANAGATIERRERLGGLLSYYYRKAA